MEHLSHCDSLPSNLHWLDIQKLTGTVTIFPKKFHSIQGYSSRC